jgi:hypothetical protein
MGVHKRTVCCSDSGSGDKILESDGEPMQRTALRCRDGVKSFRGSPRTGFINCHEGLQPFVESGGPL